MRQFYLHDGLELRRLLRNAKALYGVTTSVDVALPDESLGSSSLDWRTILRNCLPYVDIFAPSLAELVFMLDRPTFERLCVETGDGPAALEALLDAPRDPGSDGPVAGRQETLADWVQGAMNEVLEMGCAVVLLKLGERGAQIRTTSDQFRLSAAIFGHAAPSCTGAWVQDWLGVVAVVPAFKPRQVRGTTGAGDASVGGFLSSMLRGLGAVDCARMACATGAASVEGHSCADEIPAWEELRARVQKGWPTL